MEIVIPVYSDQDLTPRSMQVIRAIVDQSFPEHLIRFSDSKASDNKILVFGRAPDYTPLGTQLVYTYSVAQIMSKANAASVLAAGIRQFINEPDPIPFERPIYTSAATHILDTLDPKLPTAIDIETDGLLGKTHTPEEVSVISIAFYQPGHPPMVLVKGWDEFEGRMRPLISPYGAIPALLKAFQYGIYHNGKFDIRVLNRYFGIKLVNSFDTMLAHHVLNHAAGDHKLKPLSRRYLGAPDWERDLGKYTRAGGHYELIPLPLLVEYNGYDVYWTYKLFEFLKPQIDADENNQKAFELEMAEAKFLLGVEAYGIPMDMEYAEFYSERLQVEQSRALEKLHEFVGWTLNPNSPKQVKEHFAKVGYTLVSTDEEALMDLHSRTHHEHTKKVIELILEYRKLGKIRGTYADGWSGASRHGRVHPTYNVHGTSTGRLSSTQPNAQNMPRDKAIRKLVKTHG